jgi:hypothetical protein
MGKMTVEEINSVLYNVRRGNRNGIVGDLLNVCDTAYDLYAANARLQAEVERLKRECLECPGYAQNVPVKDDGIPQDEEKEGEDDKV